MTALLFDATLPALFVDPAGGSATVRARFGPKNLIVDSMAVVIRMKRTGRRNRPCYRISVADRAFPRDGRTLETLGVYDPASPLPELRLKLDVERARAWVEQGALPSDTVRSIFKREGVYTDFPAPKKRVRTGRGQKTQKRVNRTERKATFAEAKAARRNERMAAKRAAKQAAAAEAAAES